MGGVEDGVGEGSGDWGEEGSVPQAGAMKGGGGEAVRLEEEVGEALAEATAGASRGVEEVGEGKEELEASGSQAVEAGVVGAEVAGPVVGAGVVGAGAGVAVELVAKERLEKQRGDAFVDCASLCLESKEPSHTRQQSLVKAQGLRSTQTRKQQTALESIRGQEVRAPGVHGSATREQRTELPVSTSQVCSKSSFQT